MPAQLKFLIMRTESLVLLSTHPTPQSISTFTADTQQGNPTVLYSKLDGVFLSLSSSLSPNCPEEGSILIYQAISGNNRVTNRIVLEHIVIPVFLNVNHRNKSLPVVSWMCALLSTGNSAAMHAINSVPATYFIHQGPAPGATLLQAGTSSPIPASIKHRIEQQFAFCGKHCLRGIKSSIYPAMQIKIARGIIKKRKTPQEPRSNAKGSS